MRWILLFVCLCGVSARGEVVDATAHGFTSKHELILPADAQQAFIALTKEVAAWWDASHSFGGNAAAFSLQLDAGGCFCESLQGGGAVEHMRVVNVQPGVSLTLRGGLGPLQGMGVTGAMTFRFVPHEEGTLLKYQYVVGGYVAGGLQGLADPVDQVQLGQLQRLQQYLHEGKALNPE